MKILICSSNTGEGHNYCSKAMQAALEARGIDSDIIDTLALAGYKVSNFATRAYLFAAKSNLFKWVYNLGGKVDKILDGEKSPIYLFNATYSKRLYDLIVSEHYDAVICPHLYPSETLTYLRRHNILNIPSFYIATDYTCIPFVPETELDGYIIPHRDLIEEYVGKHVDGDKLYPLGIPVIESKFTNRFPRAQARARINKEFCLGGTPDNSHWFLMMGGSMGHGDMEGIIRELLARCAPHDRVICVCGRNKDAFRGLSKHFAREKRVVPVAFTNEISLLMDASNVLLTKPGGITSTEACIKNIPIVHTAPIPGLEDHNVDFFVSHGMSCTAPSVAEQAALAVRLCEDETMQNCMLQAQRDNTNPHSADDVISLVISEIEQRNER